MVSALTATISDVILSEFHSQQVAGHYEVVRVAVVHVVVDERGRGVVLGVGEPLVAHREQVVDALLGLQRLDSTHCSID